MTKKTAEKIVKGITDKIECNTSDIDDWAEFWGFTREEYEEFLDMMVKALEQEPQTFEWCHDCSEYNQDKHCCPRYNKVIRNAVEEMKQCEDAISREDALMCMTGEYLADKEYKPEDIISKHIRRLRALPSVQPKSKTGHWERHYTRPNVLEDLFWHCSACGYKNSDNYTNLYYHYCPNCGAKMESEEI